MPCYINIEDRYSLLSLKRRHQHNVFGATATGLAIGAGVLGVGGAVASGIMGSQAAGRAAGASAAAGGRYQRQLRQAQQQFQRSADRYSQQQAELRKLVEQVNPNIQIPAFDFTNATKESIDAANQVTANTINNIKNLIGQNPSDVAQRAFQQIEGWQNRIADQYARIEGAFPVIQRAEEGLGRAEATIAQQLPQIQRAREIVDTYLTGDIPETTKRQLTRAIAETGGAGFNPATAGRVGGFNVSQANLSENLRQTAEERQRYGLGMVPGITQQAAALGAQQAGIAGQLGQLGMARGQLAGQAAQLGEAARGWQNTTKTWMELGRSFEQPVAQMMQIGLAGRAQDIGVQTTNIANRFRQLGYLGGFNEADLALAQNIYNMRTGQAQQAYNTQQRNIETQLAADQANAQAIQGIASATSGALMGVGGAMQNQQYINALRGGFNYGVTPFGAGGGSVGGMGTFGPNYGIPTR